MPVDNLHISLSKHRKRESHAKELIANKLWISTMGSPTAYSPTGMVPQIELDGKMLTLLRILEGSSGSINIVPTRSRQAVQNITNGKSCSTEGI